MQVRSILRAVLRRQVQLSLFSALAAGCMIAAVVISVEVVARLGSYGSAGQDNIPWTVAQLEVDQIRLLRALEAAGQAGQPDLRAARAAFDLFYSRAVTLKDGRTYRAAFGGTPAMVEIRQICDALDVMTPVMDSGDPVLRANLGALRSVAADLSDPIRQLSTTALGLDAQRADAARNALTTRLMTLMILSLLMIAAMLALLVLLWRLYHRYRQRALDNRATLTRLRTILSTSPDGILVVRPDGRVLRCNGAAQRMFALPAGNRAEFDVDRILSRRTADGADVPMTGARLMQNAQGGPHRCTNVIGHSLDGRRFPVEISNDIARQGANRVMVCFIRDISDRAQAEAEIARARDRALAGERARARFLGMISHEMRTPLNGVLGALDLLEDSGLSPGQDRYVQVMKSSGQLLLEQINDALEITQTGRERPGLRPAPFDFDALLQELIASQQPLATARTTRLSLVRPNAPVGEVLGDRSRVYQILLNLVANAVKFTDHGDITVEVTPRPATAAGRDIEIQVSDTGIGIAAADLPTIFDDYVRLDDSGEGAAPGTGLGLGIARQLTELMGGHIGAESIKGEGSLFRVCLPLPPVRSGPTAPPPPPRQQTQDAGAAPAPLRVLVADDNSHVRMVLQGMLEKDGHSVQMACDGQQAVGAAAQACFDVIVMDVAMPGLDGIGAIRRIRAAGGPSAQARIVALTAHLTSGQARALQAAGVDAVHSKPLRRAALRALVATPAPEGPHPLVDRTHLAQLHDSLPGESFARLMDGFAQEADTVLQAPDGTVPSQGLAARLHRLAGSAGTVGALALQDRLCRAEAAAARGDAAALQAAMAPLPGLWQRTRTALTGQSNVA